MIPVFFGLVTTDSSTSVDGSCALATLASDSCACRWSSAYFVYFTDGNEKTAPSRTPADGQRCVIVFRFV